MYACCDDVNNHKNKNQRNERDKMIEEEQQLNHFSCGLKKYKLSIYVSNQLLF